MNLYFLLKWLFCVPSPWHHVNVTTTDQQSSSILTLIHSILILGHLQAKTPFNTFSLSPVNGGEFSLAGSARKHWLRCLVLLRKLGGSGSPGQLLQQQQTKIVWNWAVGALKTKGKPRRSRRCGCRRVMPRARQGVKYEYEDEEGHQLPGADYSAVLCNMLIQCIQKQYSLSPQLFPIYYF